MANGRAYYVNNKDLYDQIVAYRKLCEELKLSGGEVPVIPNNIAVSIMNIAYNLAALKKFSNYSYIDDMIADGIETCIRYFHCFDPEKWNNPFAYFTKIIWRSFLRRIAIEKKQRHVMNLMLIDVLSWSDDDVAHLISMNKDLNMQTIYDSIESFEKKRLEKARIGHGNNTKSS